MDPITLAAAATTLLAPYLAKAGEKAAEKIGEKLPEAIGKVWNAIAAKFKGRPAAEEALKNLAAKPGDEDNLVSFHKELKKMLTDDPAFVVELMLLVRAAGGDSILNIGSGAVATRGGVAADAGGVAVGGNVDGAIVIGSGNTVIQKKREGGVDISGNVNVSGDIVGRDKKN
jgi:hypothetical protein